MPHGESSGVPRVPPLGQEGGRRGCTVWGQGAGSAESAQSLVDERDQRDHAGVWGCLGQTGRWTQGGAAGPGMGRARNRGRMVEPGPGDEARERGAGGGEDWGRGTLCTDLQRGKACTCSLA